MKLAWLPLASARQPSVCGRGREPLAGPLSAGAPAGTSVFLPLPRPLHHLLSTLALAPGVDAPDDERLPWLDQLAARLLAAAAAFSEEPDSLVPAQRSLLLLAGRRGTARPDLADLSRALRRIDEQVGAAGGGFSRLLDAALSSPSVVVEERLDPEQVDEELRPLAHALEGLARELLALDDLAHALSSSADLAAGAVLLEGTLDLAEGSGALPAGDDASLHAATRWIARRGLDERLSSLLSLRDALDTLEDAHVDAAVRAHVTTPLALWILAHRLAHEGGLEEAADRGALERLLAEAGLVPLEVFDAASLWRDLD